MRKRAKTKKNEEKTQKNDHFLKSVLRNCLCVLAGAAILTVGIMAPKTIFAMMDKNEVDHIYVQQADTAYLNTTAQMTMEEKLNLLDWKSKGIHVSSSYPVEDADLYDDYDIQLKVAEQVEKMQAVHLLPKLDFNIRDTYADTGYETLVNLENMNQYEMLVYMVFQESDDYMYLSVDMETGKILGYTVYAYMTEAEWQALLKADVVKYMSEEMGISEEVIIKKYNYGVYNESYGEAYNMNENGELAAGENMEIPDHTENEKQFVQIGMWVDQDVSPIGNVYDESMTQ